MNRKILFNKIFKMLYHKNVENEQKRVFFLILDFFSKKVKSLIFHVDEFESETYPSSISS